MELLGVPLADQADFRHWVDVVTGVDAGDHTPAAAAFVVGWSRQSARRQDVQQLGLG
jgi:hypothetical protein